MLDDAVAFAGVAGQAELIQRGDVSARELVEFVLGRIERLDRELNAFGAVYAERALLEADQADARVRAGERRLLLGVPVAVKDEIDIAGEVTSYGTGAMPSMERARSGFRPLAAGCSASSRAATGCRGLPITPTAIGSCSGR